MNQTCPLGDAGAVLSVSTMRSLFTLAFVAAFAASSAACAPPKGTVASAATQSSYAADYPADVQASAALVEARLQEVRATITGLPRYPDELKDPRWATVSQIVEASDRAGRSADYVEERRGLEKTKTFFSEEQREISQKVAGAVQFASKDCKVDTGAVGSSLKDAVQKRMEKRLRARGDAHLLLERQKTTLGKENIAALERQSDTISSASYGVYVELPEQRERLTRMLGEADRVRRTMDEYLAAEGAYQAEAGRTAEDKKASEERVAAMNRSKSELDRATESGRAANQRLDRELPDLEKSYENALSALKADLARRTKK